MKKLLFLSLLIICFFPTVSHAQIDQRCWLEQDCYDARATFLKVESPKMNEAGWDKVFRVDETTKQLCGSGEDAAGKRIGFCLPATTAKVKISIGGQTEFTGLAEFIAFIYKYGLSVASILAVLMIIYAGVQWTISGGNAETISSAQHKIYGAVIGLVILAAAYTILYTVNPDLVNLRPPNAWMINTQKIGAPHCSELKEGLVSKNPSNKTGVVLTTEQKKAGFSAISSDGWAPTSTAQCGNDYFVQRTGALTCTGDVCATGTVCFDKTGTGPNCYTANVAGIVRNSNLDDNFVQSAGFLASFVADWIGGRQGWKFPWIIDSGPLGRADILLYVICEDGDSTRVGGETLVTRRTNSQNENEQTYAVAFNTPKIENAEKNECSNHGGLKGFVIAPNFNEVGVVDDGERHFVGRMTPPISAKHFLGLDLGDVANTSGRLDNDCILRQASKDFFFSAQELKDGFTLDINAKYIIDINDDEQRIKAYKGIFKPENCN